VGAVSCGSGVLWERRPAATAGAPLEARPSGQMPAVRESSCWRFRPLSREHQLRSLYQTHSSMAAQTSYVAQALEPHDLRGQIPSHDTRTRTRRATSRPSGSGLAPSRAVARTPGGCSSREGPGTPRFAPCANHRHRQAEIPMDQSRPVCERRLAQENQVVLSCGAKSVLPAPSIEMLAFLRE